MGGVYGEIDSRASFGRVLGEARVIARSFLARQPGNGVISAIDAQLEAMQRWTADGHEPTEGERKSVNIGLIAVRELADVADAEVQELVEKLYALNNYADDWPSDAQAASATDSDYWKRFGL
jgi:hypothetical protein